MTEGIGWDEEQEWEENEMKKNMMCLLCATLCLCICLSCTAVPAYAQETEKSETEEYRDRVLERYDQSFMVSNYYENLQKESGYLYEQWAESVGNMPAYKDFLTDISDFFLDKKLDEEAYTEYLLKLMEMVEAGFDDTAASQAMYTARVNGADVLDGGITIVSKLLGGTADSIAGEFAKRLGNAANILDYTDAGFDLVEILGQTISDKAQLAVVSAESTLYEEKVTILQAIAEYAANDDLKKAAESLLEVETLQFIDIMNEGTTELGLTAAEVAMTGFGYQNYADLIRKIYDKSMPTLQKVAEKYVNAESAKKVLDVVSGGLAAAVPVYSGFVIGSEIMKLVVGDEAECYREMRAMSEISEALSQGMRKANNAAAATDPDARYEAVREYVALGEALVYSRLRGDYCFMLSNQLQELRSLSAENTMADSLLGMDRLDMYLILEALYFSGLEEEHYESIAKVAEYYDYLEMNMESYYEALSGIFPDSAPQVIVTTDLVLQEGKDYYYAVYVPRVEVVGYEEATQKINSVLEPDTQREQARTNAAEFCKYAEENRGSLGSGVVPYNTLYLREALCIGDALSLQMSTSAAGDGGTGHYAYLFDITTGKRLGVLDMLDPENPNAKEELVDVLAAELEEQVGWVYSTFREVAEAVVYGKKYQGSDLSDVFSVSADGLVLRFSSGVILPVMGGSPEVKVDYEDLKEIFSSRFLPAERSYTGRARFYLSAENMPKPEVRRVHGEESLEAVHIVSDVYDVCIDETRYPQDWSFDYADQFGGIVFYANYLMNEMVWVPENSGGDYALSYDDKTEFYRAEKEQEN